MSASVRTSREKGVLRRRAALIVVSIAFHLVVLGAISLRLVDIPVRAFDDPPPPPLYVQLEPRPLLDGERPRPSVSTTSQTHQPVPSRQARHSDTPSPRQKRDQDEGLVSPVAPSGNETAVTGSTTESSANDQWRYTPETMRNAVARSMRTGTGGCRIMDGHLSPAEQTLCDERFNDAAGRAGPLGRRALSASEARREAQFAQDGAAALAEYASRRAPPKAGVGIVGASPECPGGNLRGTCAGANLPSQYQHAEDAPFSGRAGPK